MTRTELMKKLKALEPLRKGEKVRVVCSLIGHSRIQDMFWGEFTCGRCGARMGDTFGSFYDTTGVVIIGHKCSECRLNYKACTWRDKLYVENPFPQEKRKRSGAG